MTLGIFCVSYSISYSISTFAFPDCLLFLLGLTLLEELGTGESFEVQLH